METAEERLRLTQALTELALAVLKENSLRADLQRLVRVGCRLIEDCSGASVSMMIDGAPSTVATTDRVTLELDLVQYNDEDGPCITALGGEGVRIGFIPSDQRFPHFAIGAADRRVLSVLSTPAIDHGQVVGSLNMYSQRENAFDKQDRTTALVIAAEIATALVKSTVLDTAATMRERLQEQHDTAVLTSRAQGVLMAIHDCSAAQAGDLIRRAADQNDEPVILTAERILSSVQADSKSSADQVTGGAGQEGGRPPGETQRPE